MVAIKPKDSALLDSISDQQRIVRATSSPSIGPTVSLADMYVNPYSDDHCEATRGDIHVGRKVNVLFDAGSILLMFYIKHTHTTMQYIAQAIRSVHSRCHPGLCHGSFAHMTLHNMSRIQTGVQCTMDCPDSN